MIIKIIAFGMVTALTAILLREYKKEYVIPFEIGASAIAVIYVISSCRESFSDIISYLDNTEETGELFSVLIKGAVICVLTKLSADISKENGSLIVSDVIELAGRIVMVLLCLPLLKTVIETAISFAK